MFNILNAILGGIVVVLLLGGGLVVGMLYGAGAVDKICAYLLGNLTMAIFVLLFNAMDWVNDAFAARTSRKASQDAIKELGSAFTAQAAQARSMRQLMSSQHQFQGPPEVEYDPDLFNDIDNTPMEGEIVYKT